MPDLDPMAAALARLGRPVSPTVRPRQRSRPVIASPVETKTASVTGSTSQPFRTKKGALKFQPDSDWSLSRLGDVESLYKQRTGTDLPVRVRGQGAIHNKWNYDHHDSADISLSPNSKEGKALIAQLQEQKVPFLAFDRAIPGVSTGEHFHIGRPSHRLGQVSQSAKAAQLDPMAEALTKLKANVRRQTTAPTSTPTATLTPASENPFAGIQSGAGAYSRRTPTQRPSEQPRIKVPNINQILSRATESAGEPRTFAEDRAQRTRRTEQERQARAELRRRVGSVNPDDPEYRKFLAYNRTTTDTSSMRDAFIDFKVKQRMAADPSYRRAEKASGYANILDEPWASDLAQRVIQTEDAEVGRKARVAQMGAGEKVAQIPKSVVGGLTSGVGMSLKGVAALAKKIDIAGEYKGKETTDLATYQLGEAIAQYGRENPLFTSDPDLEQEFIVGKAPATIGQVAQFMLGGWASKSPKLAVAIMGAGMTAGDAYDEVRSIGGSDEEAVNAGLLAGGLLGPTELIGMRGAMKALSGTAREATLKATLKTALREGRRDVIENTLQEMGQELGQGIITGKPRTGKEILEAGALAATGGTTTVPLTVASGLAGTRKNARPGISEVSPVPELEIPGAFKTGDVAESASLLEDQSSERQPGRDPMAEALTSLEAKIHRAEEPYAGPPEFRGMTEDDLFDIALGQSPKGTSRRRRLELVRLRKAARVEFNRRQDEVPVELVPPDTGLRADTGDVPSFQDYVENRPQGGTRFDTLEPGSPDFNRLADEYTARYGTRSRATQPTRTPERTMQAQAMPERPALSPSIERASPSRTIPDPMAEALAALKGAPAEPAPLQTSGQKINVASLENAEVIDAQRLDGVDYELYKAGKAGVTRIYDADSGEVVGITKHPTFAAAAKAHTEAVEANGGNATAWRDAAPASAVKDIPTKAKATREELPPVETVSVGREAKAVTERGSEVATRYAIIDLDNLITSHDSTLNINPKFPQELQPRERDRAASAEQISRIATRLRPEFLGESPKASEGAPIVGPDGIVESGNGRVLALRQAYESKNPGATNYRNFLFENAERFGFDPKAIVDKKRPVLVRIRTSEVDRPQFVKEANEQSIASMSPVEQARSDAKMLKGSLLDLFRPSDSGDINTAANMNFVRAFMKDVVGPNELGRYTTASGQLSQEGVARIRNGIFARAYGDSPEGLIALEKLAESPDNNVRNITTAMLRNAPGFASLKEGIDQGTRYPLDLAPDISAAMSKMSSLRENGMLVPDYLKQGALYGEDLTPIQKRLLQVFDENKRGANTIDALLKSYLRGADAAGSPDQAGLFGTETPSKASFLEAAILEAIDAHKNVSPDLFAAPDQGIQSEPSSRGANQEVNARGRTSGEAPVDPFAPETFAPKLTEPPGAPAETEGHPLKRFDSTIDRLKAQEEEARQRLTERGAEFQKLLAQKGSELGGTTIPQDLYDYVVIGASKLAQRSLNAAQFVDEMVREFGEAIRKHARTIFTLSRKMVSETQKEIRNERLSKEIADRLFTDNVPKGQQREALRVAARFRTSTDTQGKFLSGFKSRVGEMAKSYGAAGGELTNRVHLGDIARGHEMEAGNKYLSKIQDVYSKTKNDFERIRISEAVINALENRAEADRYLDTPEKKAVYENTKTMLDEFRKKLTALGYETREDYFTHIRDVDILDQIISDAKDPKDVNLNDLVAAKSRFLQTRVDAKMEIKKDLPRVLFAYLKSVTKEIAYSDAVQYYYDHFPTDIPISLRKNSMDRAIKLMQNSLKPEQGRGKFYRAVGRLRSEQYRNFLAYNLKASAQNFTQVDFARMRWTPEARSLSGKMWRNRKALTGPLADAIDLASTKETPLMRFLEQFKGDEPSGTTGRVSEAFNKYDPFQRSEKRNWALSELGSIINSVVKRPEYKELKAKLGAEAAINKLLEKPDVFDAAVREAATTAAETQVAANPAMRGEFYDAPLHRILGMFTAFKTRQMQTLGEALRSHEGINGARAQTILRRGLSGDAQPVEVLREIEAQRGAMETMLKRAQKFNEKLGISYSEMGEMIRHLQAQEKELNGIIKRIEPLSGSRARSAGLVAKYFAKVAAISVFFNLFWNSVYSGIAGPEKDDDAEERISTALHKAFWDVLPSPFYGADPSKFLVSPVAPNFERSAPFGHITKRGVVRDVASYGTSVIPFAGVVDRATNRRLSGAVVDVIVPRKEKQKKIVF